MNPESMMSHLVKEMHEFSGRLERYSLGILKEVCTLHNINRKIAKKIREYISNKLAYQLVYKVTKIFQKPSKVLKKLSVKLIEPLLTRRSRIHFFLAVLVHSQCS